MVQWFKDLFGGRSAAIKRAGGGWQILIGRNIRMLVPPGLPKDSKWEAWGTMQTRLLLLLKQHWDEAYIYIRFNGFPPGYFEDKLTGCAFKTVTTLKKEEIFLLPDCQNPSTIQTIFSVLGLIPFVRCAFILDRKPGNWEEVMEQLFLATQKIAKKKPTVEYEGVLGMCRCLCYSFNEDLVIGKIDMPQSDLVTILEEVGKEEHLGLSIKML